MYSASLSWTEECIVGEAGRIVVEHSSVTAPIEWEDGYVHLDYEDSRGRTWRFVPNGLVTYPKVGYDEHTETYNSDIERIS